MSDPGITYRSREEIAKIRETRDPIEVVRKMLLDNSWADEKELKDIEKKIRADIEADVEKIKNDPEPAPEELFTDILKEKIEARGCNYE